MLPPGAKALALILYSDKSRLSSFRKERAYPVIACLGNLPVEIRNSDGPGGGKIVAWLPVVSIIYFLMNYNLTWIFRYQRKQEKRVLTRSLSTTSVIFIMVVVASCYSLLLSCPSLVFTIFVEMK